MGTAQLVCYCSGESFYFGIPENGGISSNPVEDFYVYVFTDSSNPVNYSIETLTGIIAKAAVSKGQPVIHDLDTSFTVLDSSYTHRKKGLHIYTEDNDEAISVLVATRSSFSVGEYNVIPYQEYNTTQYQYYVVSTLSMAQGRSSFIFLVGNADNTTITITPTQQITMPENTQDPASPTITVFPGDSHNFTLHHLETISITDLQDLTGSSIKSDKPLTVASGHECSNVPVNIFACQHTIVQIPPTITWGKNFLLSPYQERTAGQYYRIIAAEDNETIVSKGCNGDNSSFSLSNAGNWQEIFTSSMTYCHITADKQIAVFQIGTSFETDFITGDPVISYLPAIGQYTFGALSFYSPDYSGVIDTHYVNILATKRGTVILDEMIQTVEWNEVSDVNNVTVGYGAEIAISVAGDHQVRLASNFYILVHGWDTDARGYSYTSPVQNFQQFKGKFC